MESSGGKGEIVPDEAIRNARFKLGLGELASAKAWLVRRLDQVRRYYLVELGDSGAAVGVAVVDSKTGEVGICAHLPGAGPHLVVDARMALELTQGGNNARVELVWMPSEASKSPLYPIWKVSTPIGIKYVNQQKRVFDHLGAPPLGG